MIVYHISPRSNMRSILTYGFVPQRGPRSSQIEEVPAVFLFTSRESALTALGSWLGDQFDDDTQLSIFEIDLDRQGVSYTHHPHVDYEIAVHETIPAMRIRNIYTESEFI